MVTGSGGVGLITHELVHVFHAEGHDVAALSGVSLAVSAGEMIGLLGPSGSGKSTLLLACAALLRPSAGRLLVDQTDILALSDPDRDRLRGRTIAIVLQGAARNLLDYLSVAENVELGRRAARAAGAADLPDVPDVLDLVGLRVDPRTRTDQLPLGAQQLLALACSIAHRPGLLLADEPTSQLGTAARDVVLDAMHAVNRQWGTTVVLVTHDPSVAAALPRTVTIRDGRIGAEGRHGEEYSVVTADGSLSLPVELRTAYPPGTLLQVEQHDGELRLRSVCPEPKRR